MSDEDTSNENKTSEVRRLYGRQKGHSLRPAQAQLVDDLLPKLSVPLDQEGLDPKSLFEGVEAVWLEVGFGSGEHMLAQAKANPNVGFIGCEPYLNGVASLLSEINALGLKNIRVLRGDARDLLDNLKDACLDRAFLLFPDPWPKKRHHKRRFLSNPNLDRLARLLKPGSEFRVATDIPDYCRWTLLHIQNHEQFEWLDEWPEDWRVRRKDWPGTRYEAKALREGRIPVYMTFERV